MNKIKKNIEKNMLGIFITLAFILSINNNFAEAHVLSCVEERSIGEESISFYEAQNSTDSPLSIYYLQQEIMENNHNELNGFSDRGNQKRWLSPVKISYEKTINAFSFPGGYTYITDDMLTFLSNISDDGRLKDTRQNDWTKLYNLYTRGTVAFVLAHEFGHYSNEDYLRTYDKRYTSNLLFGLLGQNAGLTQQILQSEAKGLLDKINTRQMSLRTEEQADEKAVQYIKNLPWYSIGNGAIFFSRLAKLEAANNIRQPWLTPHSESTVRLQRILDYMNHISNGRVEFKNNKLYIDGKLFNNTGLAPARDDVSALDRTYFVAGQIAKAMEKGLWNPQNAELGIKRMNDCYQDLNDNSHGFIIIITDMKNEDNVILCDSFKMDYDHLLKNYTNTEKEERNYCVSLIKSFNNSKN